MRQKTSQVMKSPILLAAAVLIGTAAASAPVAHHSKTHAKHPPRTEASAKKARREAGAEGVFQTERSPVDGNGHRRRPADRL